MGKSTLLHLIGTLDRPSQGRITWQGRDINQLAEAQLAQFRNKTIGFVYQMHHLLPEFTALENILLPGLIAGQRISALTERGRQLLSQVGLEARAGHRPSELSGGEQQRVAVARALINQPRLILADEPSGNLDMASGEQLHQLLWQLCRANGQTLIIVTHNRELAQRADRVIELLDGRIKSDTKNH
ncbi:MAG: Lipoprotein-releasing system ATP-binding protein LolD [bacterium ADurb.Bin478]|nr:MAG: Lipoprotein-releasing system ATP-binding protein LolD [bacterium ADurb.Bin478]